MNALAMSRPFVLPWASRGCQVLGVWQAVSFSGFLGNLSGEASGNGSRNIEGHNVLSLDYLNSATYMPRAYTYGHARNWPLDGGNWPQSVTPLNALMLTHRNND